MNNEEDELFQQIDLNTNLSNEMYPQLYNNDQNNY